MGLSSNNLYYQYLYYAYHNTNDSDHDNNDEDEDGRNPIVVGGQKLVAAGARRPPMSDEDKVALQIIFREHDVQNWNKKTRIKFVALLVDQEERFRHLSRN